MLAITVYGGSTRATFLPVLHLLSPINLFAAFTSTNTPPHPKPRHPVPHTPFQRVPRAPQTPTAPPTSILRLCLRLAPRRYLMTNGILWFGAVVARAGRLEKREVSIADVDVEGYECEGDGLSDGWVRVLRVVWHASENAHGHGRERRRV
ncbi:hypothetical protein M422DRAFT_36633 [Sphaerobolus stellatus SS14]|uniref:Uncharacterized protein n=1 Tax=Sphaerobolus stellatus (strain SS14) TaxID=990650 RepID=A0A0C9U7C1_SPHS4|nr:hypothetical protein M422DRAFT_36633 [Sphaerobolus stellatus SS14]